MSIRALVVEDDPMLAAAHRELVGRVPGFEVVGVAHSGGEALRFLAARPVDLILLDIYLPDMTGLDLCRTLRARGRTTDVIAVTSARDLDVVRAAVTQGIVQYLLKPFTFATLRDKLHRYADYRRQVTTPAPGQAPAQQDVDRALAALRAPGQPAQAKGMSEDTLAAVVRTLRAASAELSATQVADHIGVSRVTARRYLEHLATQRLASRSPRYGGAAGRPEYLYRWVT
ncbi:MAG TPA: response regulator [Actinomycetes bacterium]|jgi:response regulator of citrate/malate metabolism|nr:response regulator [Actinomycetes bacterium]